MSATSPPITRARQRALSRSIVLGVLLLLAGILAIVLPPIAGVGITIFVGWLLIASGIGHIVYGWQAREKATMLWEKLWELFYAGVRPHSSSSRLSLQ
jgi:uncharacterized membrane protein HdeD (DUF308 family)